MHRPRNSRRRRSPPAALAALLALGACRAPAPAGTAAPVVLKTGVTPSETLSPSRAQVFRTLQSALEDGDDALAQRLVENLRREPLAKREAELVDAAEKVLKGRALVRTLELALASEPVAD